MSTLRIELVAILKLLTHRLRSLENEARAEVKSGEVTDVTADKVNKYQDALDDVIHYVTERSDIPQFDLEEAAYRLNTRLGLAAWKQQVVSSRPKKHRRLAGDPKRLRSLEEIPQKLKELDRDPTTGTSIVKILQGYQEVFNEIGKNLDISSRTGKRPKKKRQRARRETPTVEMTRAYKLHTESKMTLRAIAKEANRSPETIRRWVKFCDAYFRAEARSKRATQHLPHDRRGNPLV